MNETPHELSRRAFLERMGLTAGALGGAMASLGGAAPPERPEPAPSTAPRAPDEKIRLGVIGLGQRGQTMLKRFIATGEVEVKALCDVNPDRFKSALAAVKDPGVTTGDDHRELLKRDDIDAVLIATPDHWHAILAIEACQAGKDVYVEKPLALCVTEGRRVVQAARKHGRVVQVGTMQVSGPNYQKAREAVQAGRIGKVTLARTWFFRNLMPGKFPPPAPPNPKASIGIAGWGRAPRFLTIPWPPTGTGACITTTAPACLATGARIISIPCSTSWVIPT